MAVDLDMDASADVVLNAAGYGVARVGPGRAGEKWLVQTIAVSSALAVPTKIPQVRIFKGYNTGGLAITSSYQGALNDASGYEITLFSGEVITAEWQNGTSGERYTLAVTGKRGT